MTSTGSFLARAVADARSDAERRAERLPLREGVVAWAWVSTVVHHLDDLDAAAADLGRVLRPGGVVLVRQAFPGRMEHITLYERFFPAAGARLAGALPGVERVVAAFAGAGFREEALRSVAQVSAASLAAYRDRVRLRADTGLAWLPDDQFAAGLAALDRAVEAETVPTPVVDRLDLQHRRDEDQRRDAESDAHGVPRSEGTSTRTASSDDRSCSVRARADSHASASGGTSEAIVTRSLSMSAKAVSGLGSGASTTVPPEWRTPRIPGELIGKLCAAGSTTSMRVRSSTPQMRAESRTE